MIDITSLDDLSLLRKSVLLERLATELSSMIRSRSLSLAFPTTPTPERQAYCSTHTLPDAPDGEG